MKSNYDKLPYIEVASTDGQCVQGWSEVCSKLKKAASVNNGQRMVLTIECYVGVNEEEICRAIEALVQPEKIIRSRDAFLSEAEIDEKVAPFNGGDDLIFGWITNLRMADFLDEGKIAELQARIEQVKHGLVVILGSGASLIHPGDILVYADMPRWEAQLRMRRNEISNLGVENSQLRWTLQYKRAFFTDWRVCDRLKRELIAKWHFVLDTTIAGTPKLAEGELVRTGLRTTASRPFRVMPFFDPAPWGGQWMKETCGLEENGSNYGWCFDCVPEENSLMLKFGDIIMELPSINVVFSQPRELLGDKVHARFGDEFPIRFDFLDTMAGGNLSFQVHPLTEYIQHNFGMNYTQDESYYILDAKADATVYLGLKEDIEPEEMIADLRAAQRGEKSFNDEKFVNRWPAKKHDHFLIPAGTCHCSGKNAMVLEISATPYIFTFKMWDWDRLGLDGLPRPINVEHGIKNIQWNRQTSWVKANLINRIEPIASGPGWHEERTGLHELEFLETRRHWFTDKVPHTTNGSVNVLNLIEGSEAIVESPHDAFTPFVVHYAETFIIPESVKEYTIRPYGLSAGKQCATIKAYVRTW
ncbi:MAG: hypothetical protein JW745_04940 [Sedimentisphaerales bacterium]|nr:hypothetical protein [Sedimentisphaerales bacterium]MBN2843738.1 hypothetical protein [Sedimentisphaerales bacterium]